MAIELTQDEIDAVDECVFRRLIHLKELGLEDSKCFGLLSSAHSKLRAAKKEANDED